MESFGGVKIALFFQGSLIVYLRDDVPGRSDANLWDVPGGGRMGDETPVECATRVIRTEFGLMLAPEAFVWEKAFPSATNPNTQSYFFVAHISKDQFADLRFSVHGKRWQAMSVTDFLSHEAVIPRIKARLQDYLDARSKS